MNAVQVARWACGYFFLMALLTGVWKYACIARSEEAKAPIYVDIAHRSAFLYSFACLVMEHFAALSRWSASLNLFGTCLAIGFFAAAHSTYLIHGFLRDTDNQLQKPYKLGKANMPGVLIHGFMFALILGEIGGFVIVFSGAMLA